jgi:fatty acid synthase subunit alpha, fungi type
LWALVCTADALNNSGITDPYELYEHVHPSEVGTSLGSGMGGVTSMAKMFKDRRDEREVQNDILQETWAQFDDELLLFDFPSLGLLTLQLVGSICC